MGHTSPQCIISCEHVSIAYGRQVVLHDVCIEIPAGILLPFVGPNGAGKTTLLRAILGLIKPSIGHITTPFKRAPPGYVPQQKTIDPLYPVTTRQIVEMGLFPQLGWWRHPDRIQTRLVDNALDRFGLAEHQDKIFGELSGGMKQKAILGRAFVSGADVFVMDEPTSELDENSEREVLTHLDTLCKKNGKTVLLAHHGVDQAGSLSPHMCVVNHGRVEMANLEKARQFLAGTSSGSIRSPAMPSHPTYPAGASPLEEIREL